jgi:dTDP-4-amino-4,6-dideoxygalactose transaminase
MKVMSVPFIDMWRIHEPLMPAFESAFRSIVKRSAFVNGSEVDEFEGAFANWVGTTYCLGMSSGTDAAVIALRSAGVTKDDCVVVPALTFIATIEAVTWVGATPVLVDVDSTGLMNLSLAERELARGAKFIMPVHLFGKLVDPLRLRSLATEYDAVVIEDACQAQGAAAISARAGCIGRVAAFSFYPGKNLGALGDAGALCTNDQELYYKARALRDHGQTAKNTFTYEGHTARLDTLQAAFLNIKLQYLDRYNEERRATAAVYIERLSGLPGLSLQSPDFDPGHVYHLFVVLTAKRGALIEAFNAKGIGFGLHYPVTINRMPCYKHRGWGTLRYPWAERFATEGISLPIFPGITAAEVVTVVDTVRAIHE